MPQTSPIGSSQPPRTEKNQPPSSTKKLNENSSTRSSHTTYHNPIIKRQTEKKNQEKRRIEKIENFPDFSYTEKKQGKLCADHALALFFPIFFSFFDFFMFELCTCVAATRSAIYDRKNRKKIFFLFLYIRSACTEKSFLLANGRHTHEVMCASYAEI